VKEEGEGGREGGLEGGKEGGVKEGREGGRASLQVRTVAPVDAGPIKLGEW